MSSLFKRLIYVYIGTSDYRADHYYYRNVLGAELVWEFEESGAKVAAFDLCGEPILLIADHVKAPSKRLIYEVGDITATANELKARGWKADGSEFEVPDGTCINFKDRSGNEYALIQITRPHVLEKEVRKEGSKKKSSTSK